MDVANDTPLTKKNSSLTSREASPPVSHKISEKSNEVKPSVSQMMKTDKLGAELQVENKHNPNSLALTGKQSSSLTSSITAHGNNKDATKLHDIIQCIRIMI